MGEPGTQRSSAPPTDASRHLAPGLVLAGNYEIIAPVGEGGMAMVYRARQKSLGREVALKALHAHFAEDPDFVRRFDREAGALANLNHPNIVAIIDRGSHERIYFFVMEYVDGETLDRKIIDNRLNVKDWRAVIQACRDALEYVHKRGIIHLDIKPSNILIDREQRVKLSDFGIARIVEGTAEGASALASASGQGERAFGTSYYMAPEQSIAGVTIDSRADIYALGVTFYKMMARQMPDPATIIPPSEANHEVPVAVDAVLLRAMAPDREDRYQTVREFCDDLLKALKDQSVSIASVLDFRGTVGSGTGVLYSGADFRSGDAIQTPASRSSNAALKKVSGLTPVPARNTPRSGENPTASPIDPAVTPTPEAKSAARPKTPTTTEGGTVPPAAPAPDRRVRTLTVLLALVGLICLALIVTILMLLRQ